MKIKLLTAIAVSLSLSGYAQIKGTSALSLGVNVYTNKNEVKYDGVYGNTDATTNENKSKSFTFGYGFFTKDNSKIGVEFIYGNDRNSYNNITVGNKSDTYGGNVSYQKYYPLLKGLYAYAGGKAGYHYSKLTSTNSDNNSYVTKGNQYMAGAYGGITWFLSERFAFETNLLSANINYSEAKLDDATTSGYNYNNKSTSFNLNTQGFIDNLGFKIYILF